MPLRKKALPSGATAKGEQLVQSAKEWVESPEGQLALRSALEQAARTAAEFREAQRIDPDLLHKPVTI